jgi:hypothetical protein
VGHAAPHDSVGDASPDAVTDTQPLLDDGVDEVMGQIATAAGAPHGESDTVVPLHEGLDRSSVGHPAEREPHQSSVGAGQPTFSAALARDGSGAAA